MATKYAIEYEICGLTHWFTKRPDCNFEYSTTDKRTRALFDLPLAARAAFGGRRPINRRIVPVEVPDEVPACYHFGNFDFPEDESAVERIARETADMEDEIEVLDFQVRQLAAALADERGMLDALLGRINVR